MDDKKICFIMCCNDDYYVNECKMYLSELIVPDGYTIDLVEVRGAKCMTGGYNEGMRQSDAKYKIYMHQDVFITNKNFLCDLIHLFQSDDKIGMIGMVGTPYMHYQGTMWAGIRVGTFYRLNESKAKGYALQLMPMRIGYMEVEAVDGLLMATQYDLPWRDDLFKKWDFYDVSQSFEFLKAGYKVVVPGQDPEWYIHDCGIISLANYDDERRIFLEEYAEFMEPREKDVKEIYFAKVKDKVRESYHGPAECMEELLSMIDAVK